MTVGHRLRSLCLLGSLIVAVPLVGADQFDHSDAAYASVPHSHVVPPGVDYAALRANRAHLDRSVAELDSEAAHREPTWSREQRMAFWINAYNAFTLRAIVDHYPIRSGWLTRHPRNSSRQIDGVWTTLKWRAAGRTTLDDIEHGHGHNYGSIRPAMHPVSTPPRTERAAGTPPRGVARRSNTPVFSLLAPCGTGASPVSVLP